MEPIGQSRWITLPTVIYLMAEINKEVSNLREVFQLIRVVWLEMWCRGRIEPSQKKKLKSQLLPFKFKVRIYKIIRLLGTPPPPPKTVRNTNLYLIITRRKWGQQPLRIIWWIILKDQGCIPGAISRSFWFISRGIPNQTAYSEAAIRMHSKPTSPFAAKTRPYLGKIRIFRCQIIKNRCSRTNLGLVHRIIKINFILKKITTKIYKISSLAANKNF